MTEQRTQGRTPVVLVVEDDVLMRLSAAEMIHAAGFDAIVAANADEAIGILASRNDVAVIFTDIQMPGSMDGVKLAHAVRGRWPPIKIITTSGDAAIDLAALPEGGRFLRKPYTPTQIAGELRQLLAA
jgi:CheY-like chemotaxis protein